MSTATWEHTDHKAGPDAGPGRSDNPPGFRDRFWSWTLSPKRSQSATSRPGFRDRFRSRIPSPKRSRFPSRNLKTQLKAQKTRPFWSRIPLPKSVSESGPECHAFLGPPPCQNPPPAGPPHIDLHSHLHRCYRQPDWELPIQTTPTDTQCLCPFLGLRLGEGFCCPSWPSTISWSRAARFLLAQPGPARNLRQRNSWPNHVISQRQQSWENRIGMTVLGRPQADTQPDSTSR